jgi:hypothetical protein
MQEAISIVIGTSAANFRLSKIRPWEALKCLPGIAGEGSDHLKIFA